MNFKAIGLITYLFICLNTFSTNYYFSITGNDNNAGTNKNSPYKSIEKLSIVNLLPGDSILFKKGEVFIGQIQLKSSGTAQHSIVVSAYGEGTSLPVITGASSVPNWNVYPQDSKLYYTTVLKPVKQLYLDNTLLDLARYPNSPNFLKAKSGLTNGNIQQASPTTLTQASGYWVGATVKYRSNDWTWEYRPISGFSNGNISYSVDTRYGVNAGNTFFIENKKEQLDAKNEWYYDNATKQVIYYPANSANIHTSNVKAVLHDNGVKIDSLISYIKIANIVFDKFAKNGIYGVAKNSYIEVDNCAFMNIEEVGVKFYRKASNCLVNNCFLKDIRGRGISFVESYRNTISNNTLRRIGLIPGRGLSGINNFSGIICEIRDETKSKSFDQYDSIANHNYVLHNTIDSTGYIGIRVDGQYNNIEKNIINHAMQTMNDGGGLYCYNTVTRSSKINNNFVMNSSTQAGSTNGIYIDNDAFDMTVQNNTIANIPGNGVLINAQAHDNTVRSNTLFNNYIGICFSDWGTTAIYGNKIYQNTIVSNAPGNPSIQINSSTGRYNVAVADSNYYINPFDENIFQYMWKQTISFNLTTWRTKIPYNDLHAIALTNLAPKATAGTLFLFTNKLDSPRTVDLTGCGCTDLKSTQINQLILAPFTSQVLIKDPAKCTGLVNDTPFTLPTFTWPLANYDNGVFANDSVFNVISGISEIEKNENFSIFPNPASVGENLKLCSFQKDETPIYVQIMDITGKTVMSKLKVKKLEFKLPEIFQGIYLVYISSGKSINTVKLVVK